MGGAMSGFAIAWSDAQQERLEDLAAETGETSAACAAQLLTAVLEDDAAAHGDRVAAE